MAIVGNFAGPGPYNVDIAGGNSSLIRATTITSSTETMLTLHPETRTMVVEAVGGGGGGAGALSNGATVASVGGGGGAGAFVRAYAVAGNIVGRKLFVTVGTGGPAASGLVKGNDGTDTVVRLGADANATTGSATVITATKGIGAWAPTQTVTSATVGGGGGQDQAAPTVAAPFTTMIAHRGCIGSDALAVGGTGIKFVFPGSGGDSAIGFGGRAGPVTETSSDPKGRPGETLNRYPIYGSGGAGAGAIGQNAGANISMDGGAGAPGVVIVYEYA